MDKNKVELLLTLKITDFLSAIKQAKTESSTLMDGMGKSADDASKRIDRAMQTLGMRSFRSINEEIVRIRESVKTLGSSGTLSFAELTKAKDLARQKIQELNRETNNWGDQLTGLKDKVGGLVTLLGSLLAVRSVVSAFSEFEQKTAEVNTVLNLGKAQYQAMRQEIVELSKDLPQSAKELAAAAYELASAGAEIRDLPKALETSAKAAVAGVTDTKTAVNAGMAVINAYGMSLTELERIYDILFQTVKIGVINFPTLAQSIGDVLPSARAAKIPIEEVAAAIAVLTKSGIQGPKAVTALSGVIRSLALATPEARKKLQDFGITWTGLIGTLEQINTLQVPTDRLRELLPDEEGAKGVLSLTQNLEVLRNTMNEMRGAAGSMKTAYDIMADTPENRLKVFTNELEALKISLGALVSTYLLPLVRALKEVVSSLDAVDTPTKAFLGVLVGASAAFALWNFGLKQIVSSLGLFAAKVVEAVGASTALKFAVGASLVGVFVHTGYELYKLITALKDFRDLQDSIGSSADRWKELSRKFEDYKDVQLKGLEDLKTMTANELAEYEKALLLKIKYLSTAIAEMEVRSQKRGWFGGMTQEAIEADKELTSLKRQLDQAMDAAVLYGQRAQRSLLDSKGATAEAKMSMEDLKKANEQLGKEFERVTASAGRYYDFAADKAKALARDERDGAQEAMQFYRDKAIFIVAKAEEVAKAQKLNLDKSVANQGEYKTVSQAIEEDLKNAKIKALEDWESKLKSAYLQAVSQEQKYADEVKRLQNELKTARMTTEDKIRELERTTMSARDQWLDKQAQAYETLRAAREAMRKADTPEGLKEAADLARKAQDQFAGLAGEVKEGDKVILSQAATVKEAVEGVQSAGKVLEQAIQKQKTAAEEQQKAWSSFKEQVSSDLDQVKAQMTEIHATKMEPTMTVKVDANEAFSVIDQLKQPTSSTHTIYVQKVEQSRWGGLMSSGGKLPGWGGGDRIRALLEAGEFVIRKEAVARYGAGFFDALNRMKIDLPTLLWLRLPVMPDIPKLGYASGGPVSPGTDYGTLTLRAGDAELPVLVPGPNGRELVKTFERELKIRRLTNAR